jgi:hypothetical protein
MTATVLTQYEIDDALADSFPASDPPAWTPGVARLSPEPASERRASGPLRDAVACRGPDVGASGVIRCPLS